MNLVATHSNCTSPMDYISHHALHSHIPVHHYTHHTAVTIHSLVLIVSPHLHLIHSHTFKQHSHMHSLRSLVFPWLTFWAFPLFSDSLYLLWPFAACPFDPACLLISSLSAACPDLALSLLLILSSLHYSCYYLWPLPVWPPLVKIKLLLDLTTLPLHYNICCTLQFLPFVSIGVNHLCTSIIIALNKTLTKKYEIFLFTCTSCDH